MRAIKKGSTDQSVVIRIIDSTAFTPETAVEHNTSGIDLWYRREGATKTSITEAALAALDSAHSDGGIEHIGDGYYRLDLPDAAVATGVNGVMIGGTVTGMIVIGCYVHLVDYDPQDAVRMGCTALPNAAADAAGGLPISDAGGLDLDAKLANTNEVTAARMGALTDWINGGRLDSILDDILADTAVIGSTGQGLTSLATAAELAKVPKSDSSVTWNATALASINAEVDTALNTAIPGSPTANSINERIATMDGLLLGTIQAGTHVAQSGDTYSLANGATGFTAIDTVVDAIKAKTDNLPTDPADQSAVELAITTATSTLATAANLATVAGYLDTEIAAILADTDELQKAITDGGRTDLLIDAIKAKTDLMLDATAVANAVWDASQASHTSAGTFGLYVDAKISEAGGGGLTAAAIADAVWDEVATGHIDTGKAGAQLWTVINTLSSGSAINITSTNTVIESE